MADIKKIRLLDNTEYNLVDTSATHIQTVTLAQWEALTPQQQASGDYVISDATLSPLSASLIPYDNTTSGLTADDVQGAIDEVASGGSGSNIFKVTQAEYDALKQAGTLVHNSLYVISDGENLNATADDIEYQSGVSIKDALDNRYTKTEVDTALSGKASESTVVHWVDAVAVCNNADGTISPFNYYGYATYTNANITQIMGCSVYDTPFNNPATCAFYSVSDSTYKFIVYSARSANVRIRIMYIL